MNVPCVIAGLDILAKANGGDCHIRAEHDEIIAGGEVEVSTADRQHLLDFGWYFDANLGDRGRWMISVS